MPISKLKASSIASGTLDNARIPSLAASKIGSGTFDDARIAASNVSQHATTFDDNKLVRTLSPTNTAERSKFDFASLDSNKLGLFYSFADQVNKDIFNQNLPTNSSCKSLYSIAEKIRYECLGSKMLKGIEKNLKENYRQIINLKRKDQLKTKEDVPVAEAFELYMLKNFHKIKLNPLTSRMLNFWEKDFEDSIKKHKDFLLKNLATTLQEPLHRKKSRKQADPPGGHLITQILSLQELF